MDDFQVQLWESYIKETGEILDGLSAIFIKDHKDQESLTTVFRGFHSIKSNSRLLNYNQFADLAARGEEICKNILSGSLQINSDINYCLERIYEQSEKCFRTIAQTQQEPVIATALLEEISVIVNPISIPPELKNGYSQKEIHMFRKILSDHLLDSITLPERLFNSQIRQAIILIRQSCGLLELHTLEKNYADLYLLFEKNVSKNSLSWLTAVAQILETLEEIESTLQEDLQSSYARSMIKINFETEYRDLRGFVVENLENLATSLAIENDDTRLERSTKRLVMLGKNIERLGIYHRLYGMECAYFLSIMVDVVIKDYIGRMEILTNEVISAIIDACHTLAFVEGEQSSYLEQCRLRKCIRVLKDMIPDPNLFPYQLLGPKCERFQGEAC